jgi:hypothetical protein
VAEYSTIKLIKNLIEGRRGRIPTNHNHLPANHLKMLDQNAYPEPSSPSYPIPRINILHWDSFLNSPVVQAYQETYYPKQAFQCTFRPIHPIIPTYLKFGGFVWMIQEEFRLLCLRSKGCWGMEDQAKKVVVDYVVLRYSYRARQYVNP